MRGEFWAGFGLARYGDGLFVRRDGLMMGIIVVAFLRGMGGEVWLRAMIDIMAPCAV